MAETNRTIKRVKRIVIYFERKKNKYRLLKLKKNPLTCETMGA